MAKKKKTAAAPAPDKPKGRKLLAAADRTPGTASTPRYEDSFATTFGTDRSVGALSRLKSAVKPSVRKIAVGSREPVAGKGELRCTLDGPSVLVAVYDAEGKVVGRE